MKTALIVASALALSFAVPALAQTVEPLPAGDAAPVMVVDTPTFLMVAGGSNQFEILSSQIAVDKGVEGHTLELAEMIIADHTAAGEKLAELAEDQGLEPPSDEPAPKQQRMLEQLDAAEGADFEALYLDIQAQAHMEAVALFRTYAGSGDNQAIVGFARETLPRLETHLGHVKMAMASE